jgi:ABC-type antimicrobial peptide transport system permease subunit
MGCIDVRSISDVRPSKSKYAQLAFEVSTKHDERDAISRHIQTPCPHLGEGSLFLVLVIVMIRQCGLYVCTGQVVSRPHTLHTFVLETTKQRDEWVDAIRSVARLTHERTPSEPIRYALG